MKTRWVVMRMRRMVSGRKRCVCVHACVCNNGQGEFSRSLLSHTEKELSSEEDDVNPEGQEYLRLLAKKVSESKVP